MPAPAEPATPRGHAAAPAGRVAPEGSWLGALRRFLIFIAAANLVWEFAQLPLYTLWYEGSAGEIIFAAVHCTGGDILIASASLLLALLIAARPTWPHETYWRVAALTVASAFAYTVFSEWLHTEIRGSWAYSDLMPVVPLLEAGLSPLAQWIVIPIAAFWWAWRPLRASLSPRAGHAVNVDVKKGDTPMRTLLTLLVVAAALGAPAVAEERRAATLYKAPQCGCCEAYADYLRENGFAVTVKPTEDLPRIKRQYGVPGPLEGCHTTLVEGYVIEGHVPLDVLLRLLTERPEIKGISLPGMPAGSPGMVGEKSGPFTILEIGVGEPKVYAVE